MKNILLFVSVLLAIVTGSPAADEKQSAHTYEGANTGVVCASCKEHITAALTQKLPGVVSVSVKAGETAESQKLTIVSTNPDVTKDAATAALGSYAKNYKILSLAKK